MVIGKLQRTILGCLLVLLARQGEALVIGAPGMGSRLPPGTGTSTQETSQGKDVVLRIRSTREQDIDQVVSILSAAMVDPPKNNEFNWKASMDLLKTKVGVESLIQSRIQAMREGQRFAALISPDFNESDRLRLLWSNDAFRTKVEKAAKESTEPHIWGAHNFALVPNDPCWLQHKMLTAQDALSGEILGFCEVAMLKSVASDEEEEDLIHCAPTIVNLVTSSQHRRRGIGSRLLNSAERFVRDKWSSDELNLYVDKDNQAAISVYSNMGFEKVQAIDTKTRSQWYMRRKVAASSLSKIREEQNEAVLPE
jgi:ribosomal protein S18 acetylase RimI-like enzyme